MSDCIAPYTVKLVQVQYTLNNATPIPKYTPPAGHATELVRIEYSASFGKGDVPEYPIGVRCCGGANQTNGGGAILTPDNPKMIFDYSCPAQWAAADDTMFGNVYGIPDAIDEVVNFQLTDQLVGTYPPDRALRYADSKVVVTATLADITPWSPLQLGVKLDAWWSARLSTKTKTGSLCTQVNDLSGHTYHLLQATSARGLEEYFDGTRYMLRGTNAAKSCMSAAFACTTPREIIASVDASASATSQYFFNCHTTAAADRCSLYRNGGNAIMYGSGTGPIRTDTWTGWGLLDCLYDGAGSEFRLNNGAATTGDIGTAILNGFVLNGFAAHVDYGAYGSNASWGDVVVCNAALSAPERTMLTRYLRGMSRF